MDYVQIGSRTEHWMIYDTVIVKLMFDINFIYFLKFYYCQ